MKAQNTVLDSIGQKPKQSLACTLSLKASNLQVSNNDMDWRLFGSLFNGKSYLSYHHGYIVICVQYTIDKTASAFLYTKNELKMQELPQKKYNWISDIDKEQHDPIATHN